MADGPVTLRKKLNPVYGHLFPDFFDRPEVVETRATCDTCAMCDHGQTAPVAMDYFHPDAKCCTYHPNLPNYLVGAILADTSEELAEGRRRIREKIASRIGVTPQFIAPPRKYNLLYSAARGHGFFGRSLPMMCPYFDKENGGRCTVWKYREAVCSTYFCKYEAGKPGFDFWDSLKVYLFHTEKSLAQFAAYTVDRTVNEPNVANGALTREDIEDRGPNAVDYLSYWGEWVDREEEFYILCYKRVLALPKADFDRFVDDAPEGRGMLARMEAKYEQIHEPKLPEHLIRPSNLKKREAGAQVVVTTYNPYDAFSLDKDLFDTLGMFRASETLEENLERLDEKHDIQLAPELVRYLYVHGVLAAPIPVDKKKLEAEAAEAAARASSPGAKLAAAHDRAENPVPPKPTGKQGFPVPTFPKRNKDKKKKR
ncbi:MAG: hypothetical protein JWO86_7798 [Myxococcaceae bacterium]|jgi:Fe-S-cluster containining protein|nr:hypothetical protein [Myxococcaceae bacterium]MEA2752720.1 hypothetical protein [Myxococcales bacterium]